MVSSVALILKHSISNRAPSFSAANELGSSAKRSFRTPMLESR